MTFYPEKFAKILEYSGAKNKLYFIMLLQKKNNGKISPLEIIQTGLSDNVMHKQVYSIIRGVVALLFLKFISYLPFLNNVYQGQIVFQGEIENN